MNACRYCGVPGVKYIYGLVCCSIRKEINDWLLFFSRFIFPSYLTVPLVLLLRVSFLLFRFTFFFLLASFLFLPFCFLLPFSLLFRYYFCSSPSSPSSSPSSSNIYYIYHLTFQSFTSLHTITTTNPHAIITPIINQKSRLEIPNLSNFGRNGIERIKGENGVCLMALIAEPDFPGPKKKRPTIYSFMTGH